MYADDTVILSDSEEDMKTALGALGSYCKEWKLEVNCSKTKIVIFSKGKISTAKHNFKLGTENVEVTSDYHYLGIFL